MASALAERIVSRMRRNTNEYCEPIRKHIEKQAQRIEIESVSEPDPPRHIIIATGASVHKSMGRSRFCLR